MTSTNSVEKERQSSFHFDCFIKCEIAVPPFILIRHNVTVLKDVSL